MKEKCLYCLAHHSNGNYHKCNPLIRLLVYEFKQKRKKSRVELVSITMEDKK
jgi:hypothetical protein